MEEARKPMKIKLEDFNEFLIKELTEKYDSGLSGLRDRFQTLMTIFKELI